MSKAQKELDRLHKMRKEHTLYSIPLIRRNVIHKAVWGGKLTKAEYKEAGIMSAELAEYLVWHQEP